MKHSIETQRDWQRDLMAKKPIFLTSYFGCVVSKAEPKIIMININDSRKET